MNAYVPPLSRRELLQSLGALVVIAPVAGAAQGALAEAASTTTTGRPPLKPTELDSWVAIGKDGRVTAFFGKPDVGQGVDVAMAQIVGEELDVPADHVEVVFGDTAFTVDQGGVSGSTGVQRGGITLRNAAAEARRVLVEQAAAKLAVPPDQLQVDAGVISVVGQPKRRVTYAELVGGGYFHRQLEWNGQYGNNLVATGKAKPKKPSEYKVVGQSPERRDVAGKVFGDTIYVADLHRPGMLYARMIRPEIAGAKPVSVDEASIAHLPGAKVVRKDDLIAVVSDHEWDTVQAARALKVTWSQTPGAFTPSVDVFDHIRKAPSAKHQIEKTVGDAAGALANPSGGKLVEAEYEWPFQSHSSLAPACAVAEFDADGNLTIWGASQKPHATVSGLSQLLGMPPEKIRAITMNGPGSYGRNDAGDAGGDAAVLAKLTGRPVRVQGARSEGHGWDPKGTASIHKIRGLIGDDGKLAAYEYMSKGFSRTEVGPSEGDANAMLAGQLLGFKNPPVYTFGAPEEAYEIPNRTMGWDAIPAFLDTASPLRTSHLRDPLGPQMHFASEGFIDECALAAGADPVEFRLRHLTRPRDTAAIKAAAEKANWKPGPPGARREVRDGMMVGRGIAYVHRGETIVVTVVEVEVDPSTGRVWPRHFVVAHDCGLIINPRNLTHCIECNIVHSTSRALLEEVKFDDRNVTTVDWLSYPILDITDAPESVEVVLLDHPDIAPSGAGEPSTRPTAAAIGNAIFDATGVRLRRAPFTRDRVKAALAAAKTA